MAIIDDILAIFPLHRGAFASFLSGGFITAIVVNPPESKLAKRTSVHWVAATLKGLCEFKNKKF